MKRLSYKHAVERITMLRAQTFERRCMGDLKWQDRRAACLEQLSRLRHGQADCTRRAVASESKLPK